MELPKPWSRIQVHSALRGATGDLIVRLTPNPNEWLVLDREKLARGSSMLTNFFKPEWNIRPLLMEHPVTGNWTEMFTLSLVWDGETFVLSAENADRPFLPFPDPSSPMTPKFALTKYTAFARDTLAGGVHPAVLAAYDLVNLFALMYNLPLTLNHLPHGEHQDPEDTIKLALERFASIVTYADYYCNVTPDQPDRMLLLKDMLLEFLHAHDFNWSSTGAWVDLLQFSETLRFPELYVLVVLKMCQVVYELDYTTFVTLHQVLHLANPEDAVTLLVTAREQYLPVYKDHIGMIVHLPMTGLKDYRATPTPIVTDISFMLDQNASIFAGIIWEQHMEAWAFWRDLDYRPLQSDDRGRGLRWRQRFPRFGIHREYVSGASGGVWPSDNTPIFEDDVDGTDDMLPPGGVRVSEQMKRSFAFVTSRIQLIILNVAKEEYRDAIYGGLFDMFVIERHIDLVFESERLVRYRKSRNRIPANSGELTWRLDSVECRKQIVIHIQVLLSWYVTQAARIFRTSLRPRQGLWDLRFTGEDFSWTHQAA